MKKSGPRRDDSGGNFCRAMKLKLLLLLLPPARESVKKLK